ncbi:glycosyltransferase family 4 protein [Hymenobacter artigasi]|uniref:Glycosyltransferase involved in cell wall biosynthesis n=1 Tax=Hymenobacter artigasi TaxID=2719616 RepID=A0ABX1HHK5_9BACT|nr:glycosyltransferase family 4 protein [Hymenobacter artigasi]NKI89354.1 glycosyltransferase involved in cell wall biosynthesis [Hymenobacter artigasi]
MKIIHLILGKANPERMNGVNKVVHALATQQQRAGADVAVWGITADLSENYPAREFATRLFPAQRNPFGVAKALLAALDELSRGSAVVHLHGAFIPAFYTLARRLTALDIPYVLTPHGSYSPAARRKSWLTKLAYAFLFEGYLLRHSARVHCLGLSEVTGVEHMSHTVRTSLMPYGFEPPQAVLPLFPAARGRFRVGFCGRLDDNHKGLDCLLAGFAEFARLVPEAELWVIGDGPDRQLVADWAAEAPEGSVQLLGSRYGDEKIALLGQLDVFAHTSHYEGLPTAVLEAVALGIPCVVTEATNLGSYVREFGCGEVLATASPALLTDALHRLYAQWAAAPAETEALALRCRRMVRTAFSWPNLLPAYEQMYQEALAA